MLAASIIDSSEDAVISKDLNGYVLTWNSGATVIYGYTAAEMIGRSISVLAPPDRNGEEAEILAQIRAGRRVQHFETVRIRKDGAPIFVSLTISPILDGADAVMGASHVARDVTEQRRLQAAHAELAAIVHSSNDAIISKNLNGLVLTWNRGAQQVYGYRGDEVIGRNIGFLLPPERQNEEQEILAKLRVGERVEHFETTRVRKDGRLIHVSLTISPIVDVRGIVIGASHVARDTTERRALEEQMRQTQRLESIGILAGGIAHDFNNLLTGILGNASLVGETLPPNHPARENLDDVITAAERAADLTMQLLAYSGRGQFVVGPVNVSELVAEISGLVKASIPKSVAVRLEAARESATVNADRGQIQQLVMNIIINGAEAVPPGRSGNVVVRTGVQHLDEQYIRAAFPAEEIRPGDYVYIEVRDDGCGMDEETIARIFDPFFTTKFAGRGLGLAAALGIVKGHQGAMRVTSIPGQGSTFEVYLPFDGSGSGSAQEHAAPGLTVLVIDDEEIVRKVAKSCLENSGYRVITAVNGKEGVEIFAEMPSSIDLVVLDLTMPVMDGREALAQLRALRPDVPVILSSGYSEADAINRFGQDSAAIFMQKPYRSHKLRQIVDGILRKSR
jgi:two-component system, cell cycle sensor histidine kinase and response regulator CckA